MTVPANKQRGLYQYLDYEVSLYSGKTGAYLRYKQIPFEKQLSLQAHNRIKATEGHFCQAGLPEP